MARRFLTRLAATAAIGLVLTVAMGLTYVYVLPGVVNGSIQENAVKVAAQIENLAAEHNPAKTLGVLEPEAGHVKGTAEPNTGHVQAQAESDPPTKSILENLEEAKARSKAEWTGPHSGQTYYDGVPIPADMLRAGSVNRVIDGDTLIVNGYKIRLSLVNTPEIGESGYEEARLYTMQTCPVGTTVVYDTDGGQSSDPYGRIVAKVWCYGYDTRNHAGYDPEASLNQLLLDNGHAEILTRYCKASEFAGQNWASANGC